ncbi:hypothetical protein Poly30_07830 [Planctomycetes bacterium Poly30]|uniref:HEAT repeat protein n=1 Tax=Saltatorellus ferox TaxID=2528018 RepID=A0A518EMH3_9BACT|nr:hypothetical protein Poly30_07830 [Planctomycetes bacterium Poly30]
MISPSIALLVFGASLPAGPALAAPGSSSWVHAPAAAALADVCEDCGKGKICKAHRAHDKEVIDRLEPDLESEDVEVRMRALREVAALAREHENAPSKEAAEVLAAALEDDKLVVQREAFRLLADRQHPETAVTAYVERLKWFKGHMWTLVADMTGPNQEHGDAGAAMDVLETAVGVGQGLRDDRVVDALAGLLNAFPNEMKGEPVALSACRALLYLGTKDAAESVIKQFDSQMDDSKRRQIHFALKTFANRLEIEETPEYGENAQSEWTAWLRKNQRSLPKKLGKWTGPPSEDDESPR